MIHQDSPNLNTQLIKKVADEQLTQALLISNLQNTVDNQSKDIKILSNGITRLLTIIDNDEKTGTPGIVERSRTNDERLTVVEGKIGTYDTKLATIGGVFLLLGTLGSYLVNLFWNQRID